MKKVCFIIVCLTIASFATLAQSQAQNPVIQEKKAATKPRVQPQVNEKAGVSQTAPQNPAGDKAIPPADNQNPVINKAEKEKGEKVHPDHSKHPANGANAHGMEMKEKQAEKQKEKKEEHAEKKAKQNEEKGEKKQEKR